MRKLFLLLLLLLPASVFAQVGGSSGVAVSVKTGGTLPATCRATAPAHVFIKTGASAGLYYCSSANTWSQVGGGSDLALTTPKITTGIKDANGNLILGFNPTASADNYFQITNNTGAAITLSAVGADATVEPTIASKGAASFISLTPGASGGVWITQGQLYARSGTAADGSVKASFGSSGNTFVSIANTDFAAAPATQFIQGSGVGFAISGSGTVSSGLNTSTAGLLEVNSGVLGTFSDMRLRGVQLSTGSRPTCNSTNRGFIWYVAGGAGVLDTAEICRKDAADAYAWVTIF